MWAKVVLNLLSNALKFTFDGGITVRLGARRPDGRPDGQRHRHRRSRPRSSSSCSSGSPGSPARARAPTRARASASPWSPNSSPCTAGRSGVESSRARAARSRSGSRAATGTCPRTPAVDDAVAAQSQPVGQAGRGYRRRGAALVRRRGPTGRTGGGGRRTVAHLDGQRDGQADARLGADPAAGDGRPSVLVADDNADMRDYVSRLLERDYRVRTADDGARSRCDMVHERPAGPAADRRDDARDGRVRAGARRCGATRRRPRSRS